MFACIILILISLPVTFLSLTLDTLFTPSELNDMGVYAEDPQPMPGFQKEAGNSSPSRPSCLCTGLSA
ncbi:MAG: hypothetical protein ACM3PS_00790 [Syntrophothermus sp.]